MGNISFKFILTIISFVFLVIFAVQNSEIATIRFLVWEFKVSEAIIIIVAAAVGALIGFLVFMMKYLKHGKLTKADRKAHEEALSKNGELQAKVADLEQKHAELLAAQSPEVSTTEEPSSTNPADTPAENA